MTRAALQRLLTLAVEARRITEAQSARILADFDAGLISTPEQVEAAIVALQPQPPRGGGWVYDPGTRRYTFTGPTPAVTDTRPADVRLSKPPRARSGQTLTPEQVREVVDYAIDKGEAELVKITQELRDGRIGLNEWRSRMERMISVRVASTSCIALGGIQQMSEADRRFIAREIATQLQFLRGFARDIRTGDQARDGRMIARARQYAQAPRGVYEAIRGRTAQFAGMNEERRVLHGMDHCAASGGLPGCPGVAGYWAPIGTLPRIGRATCRARCRCTVRYRRSA